MNEGVFFTDLPVRDFVTGFGAAAWEKVLADMNVGIGAMTLPGVVRYTLPEKIEYWLILEPRGGDVSFAFKPPSPRQMLMSVGDADRMDKFDLLEDGATVPSGSFVKRVVAIRVILDFLRSPTTPPASASWIEADVLPWPEDY